MCGIETPCEGHTRCRHFKTSEHGPILRFFKCFKEISRDPRVLAEEISPYSNDMHNRKYTRILVVLLFNFAIVRIQMDDSVLALLHWGWWMGRHHTVNLPIEQHLRQGFILTWGVGDTFRNIKLHFFFTPSRVHPALQPLNFFEGNANIVNQPSPSIDRCCLSPFWNSNPLTAKIGRFVNTAIRQHE